MLNEIRSVLGLLILSDGHSPAQINLYDKKPDRSIYKNDVAYLKITLTRFAGLNHLGYTSGTFAPLYIYQIRTPI